MLQEIYEMIQPNIIELIVAILTGIASFIGVKVKKLYEEHINDETKRKVVKTVVGAVEQLYTDLSGNEKLLKAQENIVNILNEKGITISELEMKMLIEEVCNGFKKTIKGEE